MSQILQVAAIAAITLGTGAATLTVMNEDIPDLAVPGGGWTADGALDGRTFLIAGEDPDSGGELTDEIIFRDGTFQSVDCQNYCDFGWTEYQTQTVDGVVHWTTTALCPDAPHTVVWHGIVDGDEVTIDVTWTTRRWYWTNQIALRALGTEVQSATQSEAASG